MERIKAAIEIIEGIYEEYLGSENDMVNLRCYDESLLNLHSLLEELLAKNVAGKLIELPCKVGDIEFNDDDIGERVFLTGEEAETTVEVMELEGGGEDAPR